ncbi:unnamed protein product [Arabis nemorensis]|uniref:Uncharacterized protein n=1 Tax=Arabis nemorensis TaxID=586526 RepID=A0A565BB05_9BRAS|nr:unnamed protein product [Arabis nemorensis]
MLNVGGIVTPILEYWKIKLGTPLKVHHGLMLVTSLTLITYPVVFLVSLPTGFTKVQRKPPMFSFLIPLLIRFLCETTSSSTNQSNFSMNNLWSYLSYHLSRTREGRQGKHKSMKIVLLHHSPFTGVNGTTYLHWMSLYIQPWSVIPTKVSISYKDGVNGKIEQSTSFASR